MTCSHCAAPLDPVVGSCPRCGFSVAEGRPRRGRIGRVLRPLAVAATGLAVLSVMGLPLVRATHGALACEPHSWGDWHAAIERACVAPAYVCENMTSAKLLQDPEIAGELHDALRAGERGAMQELDALVGHMRDVYGCEGQRTPHGTRGVRPAPALPPGHPPIPSSPAPPLFEAPASITI